MKNSDENSNLIKTALDKDYPLHSMEEGSRRRYYFDAYSRSNMRIAAVYNSKKEAEDDLSNFAYYIYSGSRRKWQNLSNRHKTNSFIYEESFIQGRDEYLSLLVGTVGATRGLDVGVAHDTVDMLVELTAAPTYAAAFAATATTTAAARATTPATATATTTVQPPYGSAGVSPGRTVELHHPVQPPYGSAGVSPGRTVELQHPTA